MKLRHVIGDNIRCLRGGFGWTQAKLGIKTGISRDYIGRIERGEVNLGIDHLQKIGVLLKIECHYLLIDGHCNTLVESRKQEVDGYAKLSADGVESFGINIDGNKSRMPKVH